MRRQELRQVSGMRPSVRRQLGGTKGQEMELLWVVARVRQQRLVAGG